MESETFVAETVQVPVPVFMVTTPVEEFTEHTVGVLVEKVGVEVPDPPLVPRSTVP